MTDQEIESLLRKSPRVPPPPGLLRQLQADIKLARRTDAAPATRADVASLLRRWFPAISFAAIFLSCIVAIAVQTNQIVGLKLGNETLRADIQSLEPLRLDNARYKKLSAERQELEQLRKDFAELQELRAEVAQLRAGEQEIEKLRAENEHLATTARSAATAKAVDDFFARTEGPSEKAQSILCINNLKQIGLAARIWATDNKDVFPPNVLSMSNELSTPKILVCPADKGRKVALNWQEFGPANLSYEFLNANGSETNPQVLLSRCPVHGHVGLSDGSVQHGGGLGRTFTITVSEGKQVFTPLNPPATTGSHE